MTLEQTYVSVALVYVSKLKVIIRELQHKSTLLALGAILLMLSWDIIFLIRVFLAVFEAKAKQFHEVQRILAEYDPKILKFNDAMQKEEAEAAKVDMELSEILTVPLAFSSSFPSFPVLFRSKMSSLGCFNSF